VNSKRPGSKPSSDWSGPKRPSSLRSIRLHKMSSPEPAAPSPPDWGRVGDVLRPADPSDPSRELREQPGRRPAGRIRPGSPRGTWGVDEDGHIGSVSGVHVRTSVEVTLQDRSEAGRSTPSPGNFPLTGGDSITRIHGPPRGAR